MEMQPLIRIIARIYFNANAYKCVFRKLESAR